MVAYLDACLQENDPVLVAHALGIIAKAKGISQNSIFDVCLVLSLCNFMFLNPNFYCDVCGKLLTFHQISYCSNACKMKAYRKRKKALRLQQK